MPGSSRRSRRKARLEASTAASTERVEDDPAGEAEPSDLLTEESTAEASRERATEPAGEPAAEPVKEPAGELAAAGSGDSKGEPADGAVARRGAGTADWPGVGADEASARPRKAHPSRAGRYVPWAVAALAVAAAVVFAVLWRSAESARNDALEVDHRRAEVVSTATQFLGALTNFKGETIDADVRRIRSYAVGDFADQVNRFFGPTNIAAFKRAKVTSTGHVNSVFVQSISGPQASVFGVVDESITNATSAPRNETLRIDIQMLETSDGWKVSSVQILESAGGGPLG